MITDTNIYLSRWPCRRLPHDETPDLVAKLGEAGVEQAWAGSFDSLLHKDVAGVNLRLINECRTHGDGLLVPIGCVNPTLPDWEEDLRRCHDEYGMPGIRLHPNYHGYGLDDPRFAVLLELAEDLGLFVQIALKMEDERTQHPLLQVPIVDTASLPELLKGRGKLPVILLNALRDLQGASLAPFAELPNVYVEIAMREGVGGVSSLIEEFPFERVLFGSHFPFFYLESAVMKLHESDLGETIRTAIESTNAARIHGVPEDAATS